MKKTIFITGTSSGLGKASTRYFAENGWNVAATMRRPELDTELGNLDNIRLFPLDVTDVKQVNAAAESAINAFGKIDVVLNNAGMGTYGALELVSEASIDQQFAVNTRGPINVIRAFLPHFRTNGEGMFINVSSFMGITTAVPLGSLYNMSKFALEGLTEGLYYELKPLNIDLRLIEQGGMSETNFLNNIVWPDNKTTTVYDDLTQKLTSLMQKADHTQIDKTQDIVKVIAGLANRENNQFRTVIGNTGQSLMALRSAIPIEEYLEKMASSFG